MLIYSSGIDEMVSCHFTKVNSPVRFWHPALMKRIMLIQDVYNIKGTIVVGRLEADVKVGDKVVVVSGENRHESVILSIEMYGKSLDHANECDTCGILLREIPFVMLRDSYLAVG